jgi:hypothetical protein
MSGVFNVVDFLKEYGGTEYDGGFRGEVLPMIIESGIGVFAKKESKFFPTKSNNKVLNDAIKQKALDYAATLPKSDKAPVVKGAVRQTWYADILGREKQPGWTNGVWDEMKKYVAVQVDGAWVPTGDWALFASQWDGDDAPLDGSHFGRKLWVHAVYKPHPDFNPDFPNEYTTQTEGGSWKLDNNGVPRPRYLRIVETVIGESREEAEAWYKDHVGDNVESKPATDSIDSKLMALREELSVKLQKDFDNDGWLSCAKEIFNSIHNKEDISGWTDEDSGVGISPKVIDKILALTAEYPAF